MIWIVLWTTVSVIPKPCDFKPPVSEYGIESGLYAIPAVACFESKTDNRFKVFLSTGDAYRFIQNAPAGYPGRSGVSFMELRKSTQIYDSYEGYKNNSELEYFVSKP